MLCITTFLLEWLCYKLVFHFSGTPDFHSEESDSSSGSVLRRSTAEASKTLSEEWNRIERTLYSEDGEKSTRPNILEECKQWRQLHPQLRWVREYNLLHEYFQISSNTFQIWQFKKKLCVGTWHMLEWGNFMDFKKKKNMPLYRPIVWAPMNGFF